MSGNSFGKNIYSEKKKVTDVLKSFDEPGGIVNFDKKRIELYNQASNTLAFLTGDVKTYMGHEVDWAHFDFMLWKIRTFTWEDTKLEMLKKFWMELWPYIHNHMMYTKQAAKAFDGIVEDQSQVLYDNAQSEFRLMIFEKYMKEKFSEEEKSAFELYFREEKNKIDEQVEEVRKKEEERLNNLRLKEMEAKLKK